jgi:hypothetical protein
MTPLASIFIEHDVVRVTDGPWHGFTAAVVGFPSPGKLALVLNELGDDRHIVVAEEQVKLYESETIAHRRAG